MERITMADILPLIGISQPLDGRSSFNISCPCCDENPRKRHLNINLSKDVFRCPRCGFAGGIFDLYAYYTGTDRKNARENLIQELRLPEHQMHLANAARRKTVQQSEKPPIECPITDIDERDETYRAFLSMLTLASDHRENLHGRGLTDEAILSLGYKTTPIAGLTAFSKELLNKGCYLPGVPGFYHNKSGSWTFVKESRGIVIPVRNFEGKIQGLQIRRDNATKRKFRWVSSVGKQDGCAAEGWTHLAGEPQKEILLTEGPMKADIIHQLSGKTVLAVPGVNSLTQLKAALETMRSLGTEHIMTAFDMDFLMNPHVQNGYQNLVSLLTDMGFQYGTYVWDPEYKGLDDYIWQYCCRQSS